MSGTYKLYLARTMLALFSDETFSFKGNSSGGAGQHLNLNAHLTNTCLQVSKNRIECVILPAERSFRYASYTGVRK
jgi:hypothetical protein